VPLGKEVDTGIRCLQKELRVLCVLCVPHFSRRPDTGYGGAEVRIGIVPERFDERMSLEHRLDDAALDAAAAAVHEADFGQSGPRRFGEVFVDDRRDVARREGMQIEFAPDRNPVRLWVWIVRHSCTWR